MAKMRILGWMNDKTKSDRITNESTHGRLGIPLIGEKMGESQSRWFGHGQRRPVAALVRRRNDAN